MSQAIPQDEIKRPVFTTIDVDNAVRRLDPDYGRAEIEYLFSNGRKFKTRNTYGTP